MLLCFAHGTSGTSGPWTTSECSTTGPSTTVGRIGCSVWRASVCFWPLEPPQECAACVPAATCAIPRFCQENNAAKWVHWPIIRAATWQRKPVLKWHWIVIYAYEDTPVARSVGKAAQRCNILRKCLNNYSRCTILTCLQSFLQMRYPCLASLQGTCSMQSFHPQFVTLFVFDFTFLN